MKYIRIKDPIYGTTDVNSSVAVDLIASEPFRRLRGIAQYGVPDKYHRVKNFYVSEHAMGTMLLLRMKGALITTQLTGLLHDIAAPAFKHLTEWVFGDREREEISDKNRKAFVEKTEIPRILAKHGFDLEQVIHPEQHSLLELELPGVCADRVDYALRDYAMDPRLVRPTLDNLTAINGNLVFKTKEAAASFGYAFLHCQKVHWGSAENNLRWEYFADAVKSALKDKVIRKEHLFYKCDAYVLARMEASNDIGVISNLGMLNGKLRFREVDPEVEEPDKSLKKKFRWVDPLYMSHGKVHRLSRADAEFKANVGHLKAQSERGIHVVLEN